jgi:hypothetical protein
MVLRSSSKRMPILSTDRPKKFPHEGQVYWPEGLGHLLNAAYQAVEHNSQDFDVLARRGGIGWTEGMGLLFDWYTRAAEGQLLPSSQRPPVVLAPAELDNAKDG